MRRDNGRTLTEERPAPIGTEDIHALLQDIRNGNREAFVKLVGLYQKKVFLLAYSYLRNREDAMEILQETFLRVHEKLGSFRRGESFQGWLLQVAKNLTIDYYRKNYAKRKEMEIDRPVEELSLASGDAGNPHRSWELKEIFSRCLARLGERQRMVFAMRHYNGLQYSEIAAGLGISVGTVKSLHFKAVRNMRVLLSPYLGWENGRM